MCDEMLTLTAVVAAPAWILVRLRASTSGGVPVQLPPCGYRSRCVLGEAGSPVTVVSLPAGGPPAAARRAGLEGVEKVLPTKLTSTDTTERNAGMLLDPRPARRIVGRPGYWLWLLVALAATPLVCQRAGDCTPRPGCLRKSRWGTAPGMRGRHVGGSRD
jgi:hypothetical protein